MASGPATPSTGLSSFATIRMVSCSKANGSTRVRCRRDKVRKFISVHRTNNLKNDQGGKQESIMSSHLSRTQKNTGWAVVASSLVSALVLIAPLPAFAANPAEEMFKQNTAGGVNPAIHSWQAMRHSLEQFLHPEYMLRLFLSLALACVLSWIIAWHPRSTRLASLSDLEEHKTLILLGMVGAIVAELSGTSQTLAFVIFGIGALLRFRTVLDNPKLTGKAITVVVIGLACGMGSWVMAVFVTAFSWVLIFWLESRIACRLRIRLDDEVDLDQTLGTVQSMLVSRGCRLQSSEVNKGKQQLEFLLNIPAELDIRKLQSELRAMLPKAADARIVVDVV